MEAELPPLLQHHLVGRGGGPEGLVEADIIESADAYEIRVLGVSRVIPDASRDCAKRAQSAAVLIALAAEPLVGSPPDGNEEDSRAEAEAGPAPPARDAVPPPRDEASQGPWLTAEVGAKVALSPGVYGPAVGPLVGFAANRGRWVAAISGSILTPQRVDFTGASATLTRYALDLKGGYVLALSAWELTTTLGVAVDSLVISGGEHEAHLRLDFGPTAALSIAYRSSKVDPFLQLDVRWFPRDYKLIILPRGEVGRTPAVYLGATAGLHLEVL